MASINRTHHPKWVTYNGDGRGRDGYIVFCNGGLNELRDYKGPTYNGWKSGRVATRVNNATQKEATAFDYTPDGSGRDSYIIKSYGLKRNYRSGWKVFEKSLRSGESTPVMDNRAITNRSPYRQDLS